MDYGGQTYSSPSTWIFDIWYDPSSYRLRGSLPMRWCSAAFGLAAMCIDDEWFASLRLVNHSCHHLLRRMCCPPTALGRHADTTLFTLIRTAELLVYHHIARATDKCKNCRIPVKGTSSNPCHQDRNLQTTKQVTVRLTAFLLVWSSIHSFYGVAGTSLFGFAVTPSPVCYYSSLYALGICFLASAFTANGSDFPWNTEFVCHYWTSVSQRCGRPINSQPLESINWTLSYRLIYMVSMGTDRPIYHIFLFEPTQPFNFHSILWLQIYMRFSFEDENAFGIDTPSVTVS